MMAVDTALAETKSNQDVVKDIADLRAMHPIDCIENCASPSELDFLWRFLEASDFHSGNVRIFDDEDQPIGRYADFASKIDPQAYIRFEVSAYNWVRRFALGKEWAMIAEMFVRMLSGRTDSSFIDWGSFLTNSDDEKISFGGAQISMRMLGLRLKDAYRDFFRWYETVRKEEAGGKIAQPREVLRQIERDAQYQKWIDDFKQDRGVPG